MFKFIHAADIHLDSPLRGLSAYEGAPVDKIRNATREAFVRMVDHAIEQEVAFVIIAGDLYDGTWNDTNTGLFFAKQMGRLDRAGIKTFIIVGNHDAENKITKQIAWPDKVTVIGSKKPETHRIESLKVAIHGQSFAAKEETENLAANYPAPLPGYYNIGILHTALDGREGHDPYAPCTVSELQNAGYDYWALGHVHTFELVSEAPLIVFPGNIQGRHIREPGAKGAVLVTVENARSRVERVYFDVLRWVALRIDVSEDDSQAQVIERVLEGLRGLLGTEDGMTKAVRVLIEGKTRVHSELADHAWKLRSEVLHAAVGLADDELWIEKVRLLTEPQQDRETFALQGDALGELAGVFEMALQDEDFLQAFEKELTDIAKKMPAQLNTEIRMPMPDTQADYIRAEMHTLIAQLAHMSATGDKI